MAGLIFIPLHCTLKYFSFSLRDYYLYQPLTRGVVHGRDAWCLIVPWYMFLFRQPYNIYLCILTYRVTVCCMLMRLLNIHFSIVHDVPHESWVNKKIIRSQTIHTTHSIKPMSILCMCIECKFVHIQNMWKLIEGLGNLSISEHIFCLRLYVHI